MRILRNEQTATEARIAALTREREGIVASGTDANVDDEHDPEGATLAFEREQITALLRSAEARRTALVSALARAADGSYGTCAECGAPIPGGRLLARPETSTCVRCAAG